MLKYVAPALCAAVLGLCAGLALGPVLDPPCAVTVSEAQSIQAKAAGLAERMAEAFKP